MKRVFLLLSIVLFTHLSWGQIIGSTPNAGAIGKFGTIPVSHATGVPNISIPIYNLKVDGFTLPISLNYHSLSNKVDAVASSIGLGWALNAGGVISVTVCGKPDLLREEKWDKDFKSNYSSKRPDEFFEKLYPSTTFNSSTAEKISKIKYQCDLEPDIFSFNFAGGSGTFLIKKVEGEEYNFIGYSKNKNLTIRYYEKGSTGLFVITDANGIKYNFSDVSIRLSETKTIKDKKDEYPFYPIMDVNNENYIATAWYLKEIILNNGKKINFNNSSSINSYISSQYEYAKKYSDSSDPNFDFSKISDFSYEKYYNVVENDDYSLGNIVTENCKIQFRSAKEREDLTKLYYGNNSAFPELKRARALTSIEIQKKKNGNFETIKRFNIESSCRSTPYNSNPEEDEIRGDRFIEDTYSRLFLDKIIEDNGKEYSFEYIEGLPSRLSFAKDFWGYYNGKDNNNSLIPNKLKPFPNPFTSTETSTPCRKPVEEYAKKGLLSKITYPTGGTTSFEYEYKPQEGGMRIKRIISDAKNPTNDWYNVKEYNYLKACINRDNYSDGYYQTIYKYYTKIKDEDLEKSNHKSKKDYSFIPQFNTSHNCWLGDKYGKYQKSNKEKGSSCHIITSKNNLHQRYFHSSSAPRFGAALLPQVAYFTKVEEILKAKHKTNNKTKILGKNVFTFSDNTNKRLLQYGTLEDEYFQQYNVIHPYEGRIKSSEIHKYNPTTRRYKIQKKFDYKYSFEKSNYTELNWQKLESKIPKEKIWNGANIHKISGPHLVTVMKKSHYSTYQVDTYRSEYDLSLYKICLPWCHLDEIKETQYFDNGQQMATVKKKEYNTTEDIHTFPIKEKVEDGKGNTYITSLFYPQELQNSVPIFKSMVEKNIISPVVKKEVRIKDKNGTEIQLSGSRTEFYKEGNLFLPEKEFVWDGEYVERMTYDKYDKFGNVLQYTQDNIVSSFIWGYNNQYPVIQVVGVEYNKFEKYISNKNLNNFSIIKSVVLNIKRDYPKAIITYYTYKPLIGITSVTDQNELTTSYEYDDYGRLIKVKNSNGETLKEVKYNYKK